MSGKQGPLTGVCQVVGLSCDSCPEGDGVENRALVAVHKVSDGWASPGLERTLFTGRHVGERTDAAGICDHHRRWKPGGMGILGGFLLVCVHWGDNEDKSGCRSHRCMHSHRLPIPHHSSCSQLHRAGKRG